MKYLSDYMENQQTAAFSKAGAFFAFSTKQFDEQKAEGVKYWSMGAGLLCPKGKEKVLIKTLDSIQAAAIKADLKENGKAAIIQRELGNHETQLTGDLTSTISALSGYDITTEELQAEYKSFYQKCIDNDWF